MMGLSLLQFQAALLSGSPQGLLSGESFCGERPGYHCFLLCSSSSSTRVVSGRWQCKLAKRCRRSRGMNTQWICQVMDSDNNVMGPSTSSPGLQANGEADLAEPLASESHGEASNGIASNLGTTSFMEGPTKGTNRVIALISAAIAVGLFAVTHAGISGVSLADLSATAISYEEALANGKPTVLEFYADWCEVCREMAPDVYAVKTEYKDLVNFVMFNVDNRKWEEEFDEFGVEGIPHFAFLDKKGDEEGNVVGRLPKKILEDNVAALVRGDGVLPHSRVVGRFSSRDLRQAPAIVEPRSHSNI